MGCIVVLALVVVVIIVVNVAKSQTRTSPTRHAAPRVGAVRRSVVTNDPAQWIPSGVAITVAGRSVSGGMCYVGHGSRAPNGYMVEPALIDPSLKVDWARPDWEGGQMGYWPAYDGIPPTCRAAYLSWMASDRSDPSTYIGYVFLYFYGLERRVLDDVRLDVGRPDFSAIATELERLLGIYGSNGSFRRYGSELLSLMQSLSMASGEPKLPSPASLVRSWEVPLVVRVGLARYVLAGQPIPAEWALALVRTHPEINLRTPAVRCAADFDELFRRRYSSKFNPGIIVKPPKATIQATYHPASAGFGGVAQIQLGELPDITKLVGPANKLREVADDCSDALDAYSRYVGRHPDDVDSPAAVALLPSELYESHAGGGLADLRGWTEELVMGGTHAEVDLDDLVTRWVPGAPPKLSKAAAISLASLLSRLGVGIEPDVRFGASTPQPGSRAVLFELRPGAPSSPSPEYATAAALVHLCAIVAGADGAVCDEETRRLAAHLETTLGLSDFERDRLSARMTWLVATRAGLAGIKKRIDAFSSDGRVAIGELLVDVAAADGVVSPAEISILAKVYGVLGLDEAAVYSRIHALATDDGPVTVRKPDSSAQRWALPEPGDEPIAAVKLDQAKVKERLAASEEVAALLSGIFSDDEGDPVVAVETTDDPMELADEATAPRFPGLDAPHSRLLDLLRGRPMWRRADAEGVAVSVGLPLLAGALDRINEAIIESCGEPLVEGNDPLQINQYALEELF